MEVFVVNDDFLFEVIDFLLFELGHFLDHVVSRDENCFEVARIGESRFVLHFRVKVCFAVLRRVVHSAQFLLFGLGFLGDVGHQKLV